MKTLKSVGAISLILLSACTTQKPAPQIASTYATPDTLSLAKIHQLSAWVISGAIAAKNKDKAWSASLNWQQEGIDHYKIRLFGPLGSGAIIMEKEHELITFHDGPQIIRTKNIDGLLQQQTGIQLPLEALYYWVRGLPAPGAKSLSLYDRETNRLVTLAQDGYTISYLSYTTAGDLELPNKIHLKGHGLIIKLIIKQWQVKK